MDTIARIQSNTFRPRRWVYGLVLAATQSLAFGAWTPTGGGDHEGQSWTPAPGQTISGHHYNIARFDAHAGLGSLHVKGYDGSVGSGFLRINAHSIHVGTTIFASGAGFWGGGGGGGGGGADQNLPPNGVPGAGGDGGTGAGDGGGGVDGGKGSEPNGGSGNRGGKGGGTYGGGPGGGGSGGTRTVGAQAGQLGSHATRDPEPWIGSGGGGGGGGGGGDSYQANPGGGGGGGGGCGGRGGGAVLFYADDSIDIPGVIVTEGLLNGENGQNGADGSHTAGKGGNGGDSKDSGQSQGGTGGDGARDASGASGKGARGGNGGGGAGGGMLLSAPRVHLAGQLLAPGSLGAENGGTVQILYGCERTGQGGIVAGQLVERHLPELAVPTILANPFSVTRCMGESADFCVVAGGGGALSYQWLRNGQEIAGANGACFTTPPLSGSDSGSVLSVRVSNQCGSVTSAGAIVSVIVPPSIASQPISTEQCEGQTVQFCVGAVGTGPLSYQWQFNEIDLPGQISPCLDLPSIRDTQAGSYRCRISNSCGSVVTIPAQLTVYTLPRFVLDRTAVETCPGQQVLLCASGTGTAPFQYQWIKDGVDIPGATSFCFATEHLPAGTPTANYSVRVSNRCGSTTTASTPVRVLPLPVITLQPISVDQCEGGSVQFCVSASGAEPLSYQWQWNDNNIPGANGPCYTIQSVTASQAGAYRCVVLGPCGSSYGATSQSAQLTVSSAPVVTLQPVGGTYCQGTPIQLCVSASGSAPLSYQWRRNGVDIPGATSECLDIRSLQAASAGDYVCRVSNSCGTQTSSAAKIVVMDRIQIVSQPTSVETSLGLGVKFCVEATGNPPLKIQWFKNGVAIPDANSACFQIGQARLEDQGSYVAQVSDACETITSAPAALRLIDVHGSISGYVWNDLNSNGVRDGSITGDRPDVVFIVDRSTSTLDSFVGSPVGDVNGDGRANTILDAEIKAFVGLNQFLVNRGLGNTGRVSVVTFDSAAHTLDFSADSGLQPWVNPAHDTDGDGVLDMEEVLVGLRANNGTNFEDALAHSLKLLTDAGVSNSASLVFLSDGKPTVGGSYTALVRALRSRGVSLRAFGVGAGASLPELQVIDPDAKIFTNVDELIKVFSGLNPGAVAAEPALPLVPVYIDINNNREYDDQEPFVITDVNGYYRFSVTNAITTGPFAVYVRQVVQPGYLEVAPGLRGDHFVILSPQSPDATIHFGSKATEKFLMVANPNSQHPYLLPFLSSTHVELQYGADIGKPFTVRATLDFKTWRVVGNYIGTNTAVTIRDFHPIDTNVPGSRMFYSVHGN